jgi:hypothetical protein
MNLKIWRSNERKTRSEMILGMKFLGDSEVSIY